MLTLAARRVQGFPELRAGVTSAAMQTAPLRAPFLNQEGNLSFTTTGGVLCPGPAWRSSVAPSCQAEGILM